MMRSAYNDNRLHWQVNSQPCCEFAKWAKEKHQLFASQEWAKVVQSLGANVLFAWNAVRQVGVVLPIFHRLGMRVGFLGFPVTGNHLDELNDQELVSCCQALAKVTRIDVLRATQSMRKRLPPHAIGGRPEAWIGDLQQWKIHASKRLRKDIAFAKRACKVEIAADTTMAEECFALYAAVVTRRNGVRRYGLAYFRALAMLARSSRQVGFFAATEQSSLRGFATVAIDGETAYYLHGAVDAIGRRQGLSDLLLERLVEYAQAAGATRFSLMASPWEQPGLQQFKQKWADSIGLSVTYDFGYGFLGRGAAVASRWQRRNDFRQAAESTAQPLLAAEG